MENGQVSVMEGKKGMRKRKALKAACWKWT